MPRPTFRATFENGVMSQDWLRRIDTEQLERSLKTGSNILLKAGGGLKRRPGSVEQAVLQGAARIFRYQGRGVVEDLVFTNARLDIYDTSGSLLQSITSSVDWTTSELGTLRFEKDRNSVFVFHEDITPQVITRASDGTWSLADFAFATSIGSNTAQPYYTDFNDIDVTMTVSAYSGSGRTMTFSSAVLNTDGTHVGVRFRYMTRCEVEITAVTNATTATVTIYDELYPTLTVTVADSSGYKVGHVVEGSISQVRGIVVAVPTSTTVSVANLEGYDVYEVITGDGLDKDRLVGPEARQEITGVSTAGTPASTAIWDEQLISPARGYPKSGVIHRGRLWLAGFPQAPSVLCASTVGNVYNFSLGADDEDGINVELGDDPNTEIRHLVSAEQLLIFTDRGIYYAPEGGEGQVTPETIEFLRISGEGCGTPEPVLAAEGVLFIDEDAGRLMIVTPTGNVRRSWTPIELSEYGFDLLNSPVRIAVANGLDGRTERYVLVLNSDGTMAVMMYRRGSDQVGFVSWSRGTGTWTDVFALEDDVLVVSKISTTYRLSQFDFSAIADDEVSYASAVSNRDGDDCDLVYNLCVVTTETVASGEVPSQSPAADFTLGYDFAVSFQPASPLDQEGWIRRRIPVSTVEVYSSGAFSVNEQLNWPFDPDDDLTTVGAVQSREHVAYQLGFDNAPVITVAQAQGAGALLDVAGVTMEIS